MQQVSFKGMNLSKLMLGTVQFGLDYGVANSGGKPTYEKARDILASAFAAGVNCFDTAALYGESEEVLGRAFAELEIKDKVTVVTKLTKPNAEKLSAAEAGKWVESSIVSSLKKLRLDALSVCLFHVEGNIQYIDALLEMKSRGLVKYVGASADSPEGADSIIRASGVECMQLPFNVFDKRYEAKHIMERSAANGIALFARSVYLQGLLLMSETKIIRELQDHVVPVRRRLENFAKENDMSMAELCMRFVLSRKEITCVLTGVDSLQQLQENIALFAKGPLTKKQFDAVVEMIPDFPEYVVRPSIWSTF